MLVRFFSAGRAVASNIGSSPILLPTGASVKVLPKVLDEVTQLRMQLDSRRNGKPRIHLTQTVEVTGPKGSLSLDLADFINLKQENAKLEVGVTDPQKKHQRSMWGTTRSLVANSVTGVTEGHLCIVKFVGTGFRAILEQNAEGGPRLNLRVGYSDSKYVPIPAGVNVSVPVPHRVVIEGCDKQQVKLLAAEIRKWRKPEPYKGKGIFIDDETIKLKQKKIK